MADMSNISNQFTQIYVYTLTLIKRERKTFSPVWQLNVPFSCQNICPLHPRMLCAKFGWNRPSVSGEEDEHRKSLQTDWQTDKKMTDDRWSEKLTSYHFVTKTKRLMFMFCVNLRIVTVIGNMFNGKLWKYQFQSSTNSSAKRPWTYKNNLSSLSLMC